MTPIEIGTKLAALIKAGKNEEAMKTFYAEDIVSVEAGAPPGGNPETHGIAACIDKGKQFRERMEVHSHDATGPFPNGDRFTLVLSNDVTPKAGGPRFTMTEVALYTVKGDKIVREEFFYKM